MCIHPKSTETLWWNVCQYSHCSGRRDRWLWSVDHRRVYRTIARDNGTACALDHRVRWRREPPPSAPSAARLRTLVVIGMFIKRTQLLEAEGGCAQRRLSSWSHE